MRRALLVLAVRLALLGGIAGAAVLFDASDARAALKYADQVVERTLDNGFKMILLEDHKAPVAVVQVWYRVGSRNETPGLTGLSHMLEHMMFKGTQTRGPEEYSRIISRNGGNENAFTADDATTYFATLAADRVQVEIDLEADRMRNLVLTDETFEPERSVVMEERRMRIDNNPISFMYESLGAATFVEHPYRQPTIGWAKDIAGWKLADLRRHYDTYYQPNNAFLVAVGDFDAAALGNAIAEKFGPYPRAEDPPPVRATEPEPRGAKRVWVEKPAKLPFFAAQWHVPNLHHADSPALEMLEGVLSGGKSARFYRTLVHEQRLALEVDASYDRTSIDDKVFTVSAQPQPGVPIDKLEAAIQKQIAEVQSAPPSPEELGRARAQIEAAFVFAQDSMFYRALLLGTYETAGGWRQIDEYLSAIASVKPEDVQRVAKTYLVDKNRTTGVLVALPTDASAPIERPPSGPIH
ncbi:MAG TPA: pitrilysin family protein [Candidatus Binatia bacterium]|nr:pitrilysin family protein [Candidatus Binatia bacterium]